MNFEWKATYKDNSTLKQFTGGQEAKFSDIDLDNLDSFYLYSTSNPTAILLNFRDGNIYLNGNRITFGAFDNRLIYFRRVRQDVGMNSMGPRTVNHIIGMQATVDGKNKKLMFAVNDNTGGVSYFDN